MNELPFTSWINEQKVDQLPKPTICKTCDGRGWVRSRPKYSTLTYAALFRCYCPIGMGNKNNWPVWGRRFDFGYEIIRGE